MKRRQAEGPIRELTGYRCTVYDSSCHQSAPRTSANHVAPQKWQTGTVVRDVI